MHVQGEHSAILYTFIELPFCINTFVYSILSGRLRQVLLYMLHFLTHVHRYQVGLDA